MAKAIGAWVGRCMRACVRACVYSMFTLGTWQRYVLLVFQPENYEKDKRYIMLISNKPCSFGFHVTGRVIIDINKGSWKVEQFFLLVCFTNSWI